MSAIEGLPIGRLGRPQKIGLRLHRAEDATIDMVEAGEATVPHIRHFHDRLGLNERVMQVMESTPCR